MINYTFLKNFYSGKFKYAKNIYKLLKQIKCYSRKCTNSLLGICEKTMQNLFAKIVQSASFCSRLSIELYNQNDRLRINIDLVGLR